MHISLPIKIKSKANNNQDLKPLKEVSIKGYGDDIQILPVGNTVDV